jgi:hypothetical protein
VYVGAGVDVGEPEKHVVYNFDPIAIPKLDDLSKDICGDFKHGPDPWQANGTKKQNPKC